MDPVGADMKGLKPQPFGDDQVVLIWADIQKDQEIRPASHAEYLIRTVQVYGTFGGASLEIVGSLDPEQPTHWDVLHDRHGQPLIIVEPGIYSVEEPSAWIAPRPVPGGGSKQTKLTVAVMACKGPGRSA